MSSASDSSQGAAPKLLPAANNSKLSDMQKNIVTLLEKFGPFFLQVQKFVDTVEPYVQKFIGFFIVAWKALEPYHPEDLGEALFGLFLAFFGGQYLITLAAIEAYRLCGYDTTLKYLTIIWEDYKLVRSESRKDDQLDENQDGVADVTQITKHELFSRKARLMLKSCNPDKLSMAMGGLYTGFMGVIASLRLKFAQTITLGVVIGGTFASLAQKHLQPVFARIVSSEYQKWCPVIIEWICKAIGVWIAWTITRVISAFYSAVRGAQLAARGLLAYGVRHKHLPAGSDDESSYHYAIIVAVIAFAGFFWQLSNFFKLPFPFNIVLFPVSLVESFLMYFVSFDTHPI